MNRVVALVLLPLTLLGSIPVPAHGGVAGHDHRGQMAGRAHVHLDHGHDHRHEAADRHDQGVTDDSQIVGDVALIGERPVHDEDAVTVSGEASDVRRGDVTVDLDDRTPCLLAVVSTVMPRRLPGRGRLGAIRRPGDPPVYLSLGRLLI